MLIRDAEPKDLPQIVEIVNAFLPTTTYEWTETPHTLAGRTLWLEQHRSAGDPVLVAELDGEIAGFANFGDFRDATKWPGYRFVVEHTIHVRERHWRAGQRRGWDLSATTSGAGKSTLSGATTFVCWSARMSSSRGA